MNYYNLANYFYDIASKHSNQTALYYNDISITYSELNKLSNKIANYFLSLGIKEYDVVGIFSTKEPTGYASMLACLKIGATYTNMDEENPPPRAEKIIASCCPKILVSDCDISQELQNIAKKYALHIANFKTTKLLDIFGDEDIVISQNIISTTPAYIMFTSGSTGTPKGVTISHLNLLSFLHWGIKRYEVTPKDRFAGVSPLYFDNSVFDFYTALFSGAGLVPIKKELTKNPQELVNFIDKMRCTIYFSVPSLLVYLLTMKVLNKETFQSIRVFTFGGEGFPKGELKKLYSLYGKDARFINVYGPTEGTCICSSYDISEKDFQDMQTLAPLGTINPNFKYLIVDEAMQEVRQGEKGELCLAGQNVALGYYNDIERSSQNFVQNPLIKTHKDIIYKTGDVVYEKDGLLWFAGRVDNQVKHMGYRIELEEIESALNGLYYINQSAVIYERTNQNYGKIIAFVTAQENTQEIHIKNDLKNSLPSYMIPNIVIIVQSLPKNQNGKIDKKQLVLCL